MKEELADGYFKRRFEELKQLLFSEVELRDAEVELGAVKLNLKRLKSDEGARKQIRNALRDQVSTLLAELNSLLDAVRVALRRKGFGDLVLIVDNLEKIRKVANAAEGYASQKELFLEQHAKLTGFNAHVIYTAPLRLVRSTDAPQLNLRYDGVHVLPMVKTAYRDGRECTQGIVTLQQVIARRVAPAKVEDVFTDEALEMVLRYCGGHVRHLILFVRTACASADALPIDKKAAARAVQQLVAPFSSLPDPLWDKMVAVDRSSEQRIVTGDPDYLALLENTAVLEYIDGTGDDPFLAAEPWYAVHPVIRALPKFHDRAKKNGAADGDATT